MQLVNIDYSELEGTDQSWTLENCVFGQKTLVVGKNASGKSRTLRVIEVLAQHLAGLRAPTISGTYNCTFTHLGQQYSYHCMVKNSEVLAEVLRIDNRIMLERGQGGIGKIWAEKIDAGLQVDFQTPPSEFAAVARRDSIQHSFLEPLYSWATSVRYFQFGTNIGKDSYAQFVPEGPVVNERNQASVIAIFRNAKRDFGDAFLTALIEDMRRIDYELEYVDIGPPIAVMMPPQFSGVVGLVAKERDWAGVTDQLSMSQGMYRVLSLLIYVNYFQLKNTGSCLLIDDIGEGLDFDRSCRLIGLLRQKAEQSKLQIIISTNDRFVMNEVPLEEWSIIQRKGSRVRFRNITNSKDIFESFKFTGLSNFSFLELDVLNSDPEGGGTDA